MSRTTTTKAAKRKGERIALKTPDFLAEQAEQLRRLLPQVFTEGKIDVDKIRAILGEAIDERAERYSFTWAGKRQSILELQIPTWGTLVPAKDESVNFDEAQNIFVEGENLEVLKLLYKAYFGRVKMIYIDPPYNTGKRDFVYPDNFADPKDAYLKITGQTSDDGNMRTSNPETSGRYHSAWLSMIYPRLFLARQLLHNEGFLVVSIDDAEVSNLKQLLNEIMGEENFVASLVWDRNRKNDATFFSVGHEYMLVYARDKAFLRANEVKLRADKEGIEDVKNEFDRLRKDFKDDWDEVRKGLKDFFSTMEEDDPRLPLARFSKVDDKGPYRDDGNINWPGGGGPTYEVLHPKTGKPCKLPTSGWRYSKKSQMEKLIKAGRIVFGEDETTVPSIRTNLFDKTDQVMGSVHYSYAQKAAQDFDKIFGGQRVFDNPKSFQDLRQLVEYLTDDGDLVMDFFAGSCSLGHAVLESNRKQETSRRFVCVQIPEPVTDKTKTGKNALKLGLKSIADIGKERLRRVIKAIEKEDSEQMALLRRGSEERLGFQVFHLVPSNFKPWLNEPDATPEKLAKAMELFNDPLLDKWKPENVVYEIAVKEGFSLSLKIEKVPAVKANKVFRVTDTEKSQSFRICLDDEVKAATVRELDLSKDELFICRDVAIDDKTAANLALQCRLKTI